MRNVTIETNLVTPEGKLDLETLSTAFEVILKDAEKANKGNTAAARRFRINTKALEKAFPVLRATTPKKK